MSTLADSLVSSSSRKLPIRKRPDLKARKQRYQGRVYWVVKDPVGLQYYRFEEEEYAILQMLDGHSSLDEIAQKFERDFPPQTIRTEELQQFIGMLHRSGLVITDAPGQGQQLEQLRGIVHRPICKRTFGASWRRSRVRARARVTLCETRRKQEGRLLGHPWPSNRPNEPQQT